AVLDLLQQPGRDLAFAALGGDHLAQLGFEVVGLQAVQAALEVVLDEVLGVGGELLVEERLQFSQCLAAVRFCHRQLAGRSAGTIPTSSGGSCGVLSVAVVAVVVALPSVVASTGGSTSPRSTA